MKQYSTTSHVALFGLGLAAQTVSGSYMGRDNYNGVGTHAGDNIQSCFDVNNVINSCGSHCWPNCNTHSGVSHPNAFDYNHYMVIPENTSCYVDTNDYGRFDLWLSKNSGVKVTYDTYEYRDGVCQIKSTGVEMDAGALRGDPYCQIFALIDMHSCGGCSQAQRRIETYTTSDRGCGGEFYIPPTENTDDNNNNDEEEKEDNTNNDDTNTDDDNKNDNTDTNDDKTPPEDKEEDKTPDPKPTPAPAAPSPTDPNPESATTVKSVIGFSTALVYTAFTLA